MNTELIQQQHEDFQRRLIATRERIRQAEAQLQDLANAEQQLLGAIAFARQLLAMQPEAAQPAPSTTTAPALPTNNVSDIDNPAQ